MAVPEFIYRPFVRLFPRASVELASGSVRSSYTLMPFGHADGELGPSEGRSEPAGGAVAQGDDGESGYANELVRLAIRRAELDGASRYTLVLKNLQARSLQLARLRFPGWRGLDELLADCPADRLAFLRNGHQSWSTARSYRMNEKPLLPRLKLVSLATSNLANLPSNTPGRLSSELYTLLTNLDTDQSILIGQGWPFNQFLYLFLNVFPGQAGKSYFELVYDFGRALIGPGQKLVLDELYFMAGPAHRIQTRYFELLKEGLAPRRPFKRGFGWCSWYQYYDRIDPELLYKNLRILKESGLPADFFQIDDGWQSAVGDWLTERSAFKGRMAELAAAIKAAGYAPGLWFAPFAVAKRSRLFKEHPEYLLRDSFGRPLLAGYNPIWKGFYYGLDASYPACREYLEKVVETIVRDWGFSYLKCDFLFAGCLRGADHHEIGRSRAELLKEGMRIIRAAAGPEAGILGCGMPLSVGVGVVDAMRIGPDTGHFWIRPESVILRTGAMVGLRNSIRASLVRAPMHSALWVNDPDCVMARASGTRLSAAERRSQFDVAALSGGFITLSDDLSLLGNEDIDELRELAALAGACRCGRALALDVMERELPEQLYNDAGYLGLFNWGRACRVKRYELSRLLDLEPRLTALVELKGGQRYVLDGAVLELGPLPARGSAVFRLERRS